MDYAPTYVEGATTGQLVVTALIAGFVAGATIAVILLLGLRRMDRSIDRVYSTDEWREVLPDASDDDGFQRGRFARLRERFRSHDIEGATDDPEAEHEPIERWLPPARFAANGTKVHKIACGVAGSSDPIEAWNPEAARHWAEAEGLQPCGVCKPFEVAVSDA